jgi:peptidyl-prolyl cis-trans isomerase C
MTLSTSSSRRTRSTLQVLAVCLALTVCVSGVRAAEAAAPFATVNGEPVQRAVFEQWVLQRSGVRNPYDVNEPAPAVPAADRLALAEEWLLTEVLAQAARQRGLDTAPSFQLESRLQRDTLLSQAAVRGLIGSLQVTDAELTAAYEDRVPAVEFRVAHILVADEAQAIALITRLQRGEAFGALARRHSLDKDTRSNQGAIGWLHNNQMAPDMAARVRRLAAGELAAQPARSDRGWHVVKLLATRPFERPDLATARAWLHPFVLSQKVQVQLAQWRAEADIRLPEQSAPAGSAR